MSSSAAVDVPDWAESITGWRRKGGWLVLVYPKGSFDLQKDYQPPEPCEGTGPTWHEALAAAIADASKETQ